MGGAALWTLHNSAGEPILTVIDGKAEAAEALAQALAAVEHATPSPALTAHVYEALLILADMGWAVVRRTP